jgi:hypothetical protein
MKLHLLTIVGGAAALGACATTPTTARNNFCNADHVQGMVGQKADAAADSPFARRPAPTRSAGDPRTPMTMDFRQGRVTVAYDDAMIITRISCG